MQTKGVNGYAVYSHNASWTADVLDPIYATFAKHKSVAP